MMPTRMIDPHLLDNRDAFADPFFQRFTLRPAPQPLSLDGGISKNYLFPTLYSDVTCAIGIFLCSHVAAARLMPHPQVRPVRMTRGRALVAFSCYVYRRVLGVAPYNEIAMAIPVQVAPRFDVPVLPMLAPGFFRGFGYHVFSMPVTSLENQIRGVKIWGLPKIVQRIDIETEGSDCVTTAFDDAEQPYFHLRVPVGGTPQTFDVQSKLITRLGGRLLSSLTCFRGTFQVNKYPARLLGRGGAPPARECLRLGNGPAAAALRELEIEPQPFQFRYAERMSSCFDLPDPDSPLPV